MVIANFKTGKRGKILLPVIFILALPSLALLAGTFQQQNAWHLYDYIFGSPSQFKELALNTFLICGGSAGLALILGAPVGFLIFRARLTGKRTLLVLTLIAIAVPIHVHASTWLALLGHNGLLTSILKKLYPHFSLYTIYGGIWVMGLAYTPLAAVCSGLAFKYTDQILEEESATYLPFLRVFIWATMPQAITGLFLTWSGILILALGEMTVTDLLALPTLARKIYLLYSVYYQPELAVVLGFPIMGIVGTVVCLVAAWLKRRGLVTVQGLKNSNTFYYFKLKMGIWGLGGIICLFWLPFPVMVYTSNSFNKFWCVYLATVPEFWNTLYLAALAALLTAGVALPTAWLILRNYPFSDVVVVLLLWQALLPGSLTGIGILRLWSYLTKLAVRCRLFFCLAG